VWKTLATKGRDGDALLAKPVKGILKTLRPGVALQKISSKAFREISDSKEKASEYLKDKTTKGFQTVRSGRSETPMRRTVLDFQCSSHGFSREMDGQRRSLPRLTLTTNSNRLEKSIRQKSFKSSAENLKLQAKRAGRDLH